MSDKVQNPVVETPSALQLLDLSTRVGKAVCRYMLSGNISKERFSQIKGNDVDQLGKKIAHELIQLIPDEIITQKELIQRFYLEIFNHRVDLSKVPFSEKNGFPAYCYNARKFNIDQILTAYQEKWGINIYKYKDPAAKEINNHQDRPKGPYVFAHRGGDEPDKEHLGKSFDMAMAEGFPFANAEEYYLMQGLHKYSKGHFMDKKGWTRFSSLWSDGDLVLGRWREARGRLYLNCGYRDDRYPDDGPRELFLFS